MPSEMTTIPDIGPEMGCPSRAVLLALAAATLGMALELHDGLYSRGSIILLTLSLALCALAVLGAAKITEKQISIARFKPLLGILLAVQVLSMLLMRAGASQKTVPPVARGFFNSCLLIAVVGLTLILFGQARAAMKGFVLMLMMFVIMGVWKIRTAPSPRIDVFVFHRDAADALANGKNPYAITFPDIYGPRDNWVYGQDVVKDGRLQFGYPYPPLTLLMTAAAKLSLGDARYAMLAAMLASGVMIYFIRPDQIGMLAAALLLFTPRSFFILESAWTEPLSVMLLAAMVLFASDRLHFPKNPHPNPLPEYRERGQKALHPHSWLTPIGFGLLIASKQYLPAAIALAPIMFRRLDMKLVKFLVIALFTALVVTLPLALWDFKAFWESDFTLQLRQPYRSDSLGYLAWWGSGRSGWKGPFWVCFVAMALAMGFCFARRRRGIDAFVNAVAICFFAFFALNKQAFANYYYFVLGAICCAIVTCGTLSHGAFSADRE